MRSWIKAHPFGLGLNLTFAIVLFVAYMRGDYAKPSEATEAVGSRA